MLSTAGLLNLGDAMGHWGILERRMQDKDSIIFGQRSFGNHWPSLRTDIAERLL